MATQRHVLMAPADDWGPLPPHAIPRRRRGRTLRLLERLLIIVGIVSLGYFGYVSLETALYQSFENRELDAILASAPPSSAVPALPSQPRPRRVAPANGAPMGRI